MSKTSCSICTLQIEYPTTLKCGHVYHRECLSMFINTAQNCPIFCNACLTIMTDQIWQKFNYIERKNWGRYVQHWAVPYPGPKLTIAEDGFIRRNREWGWNCIRTKLPIPASDHCAPKPSMAFYYEVQIMEWQSKIVIGFYCHEHEFQNGNISIGVRHKGEIWIYGSLFKLQNYFPKNFMKGDVIGIGIVYQPNSKMECFTTWEGKLQGKIELPDAFVDIKLYPAFSLFSANDSIRVVDKAEWRFNGFVRVLR